ncbi:MAG TPA: 23S rRNA (pseudouridine(1915)-N(3))-methyltransferase RlmH [Planctomycetota bacterium]|nr:23S rRNA (pseudouridine(1915)-N(3))-methyltransferase RlmH [Planctomycetota bacterium]
MKVVLLTVGKPRSAAIAEMVGDYLRRLGRHAHVEWTPIAGEDVAPKARAADVDQALAREGERLLAKVPAGALLVALDRAGREWSSPELARELAGWQQRERAVAFAVGSAHGLHGTVLAAARQRLSLSRLTLPHEIALLVLVEQLYRAHAILRGDPYHK